MTPTQKGLKYYRGRTITWVAPSAAGAPYDTLARAIAPAMGAYLHATVNVEDISAGNGIAGQDIVAASPPTGLEFTMLGMVTDIAYGFEDTPGVNFNLEREGFIGVNGGAA